MDPNPSGADSLHVIGCTPQLKLDDANSIDTNGRIPISDGLQAASGKGKFLPDNGNACEKYNDSDDNEWFLGFDEKGNDVYMKHCKVLGKPGWGEGEKTNKKKTTGEEKCKNIQGYRFLKK